MDIALGINQPPPTQLSPSPMLTPGIDLASRGINQSQAEILRSSLATFANDWSSPEMSLYDNYDAAKINC
jgi:hypothetical protein